MTVTACRRCGEQNPEGAKFCNNCASPLGEGAEARGEVRKTVTVLFADIVSSTSRGETTDPESARRLLARYFEAMRRVLEGHGGTVEKFIGDAVMAVFGIPTLHEDDALRAVGAAQGMLAALGQLNDEVGGEGWDPIAVRIGINTGEVVAGDPAVGQTLVTGDAVNVAARLEQAAAPGEVLIGHTTLLLVRDGVDAEPLPPIELKGKAAAVRAYRLLGVTGSIGSVRRHDTALVGRERELRLLREAFERAVREDACHLFTLLGPAGVGKSRLIHEFLIRVRDDARVLRARCLPYGEGITFYPVAELVQAAAQIMPDDAPASARAKLQSLVRDGGPDADLIAERVAGVIGLSERSGPSEEIFWAVRKLLETLAAERPLVVVIDDLHWAEPTLLDLVDHIADWSRSGPILLLCVARAELLDARPQWSGGKLNATTILLEQLTADEAADLIGNLVGDRELGQALQRRISEATEGNPLFVEELVSMLIDDGMLRRVNGGWEAAGDLSHIAVPPTVSALVAARLDRLASPERDLIGRAAVVGKVFQRSAVAELTPPDGRSELSSRLMTLVRKELVRPDRSDVAGDEAFRFRHILVRDAAYGALPKEQRAELHARFADWLERAAGERLPEYEEIVGYHLEQAHRYRSELGIHDESSAALGRRAAGLLDGAGQRALQRDDAPAASNLLSRAVAMLPALDQRRCEILIDLAIALRESGRLAEAEEVLTEALATSRAAHDELVAGRAELHRITLRAFVDPSVGVAGQLEVADRCEPIFASAGDHRGLAAVAMVRGDVHLMRCNWEEDGRERERTLEHAGAVGDERLVRAATTMQINAIRYGPTPASLAIQQIRALKQAAFGETRASEATLVAMLGRFDEARQTVNATRTWFRELGLLIRLGSLPFSSAEIERLAGDLPAAERELAEGTAILESIGETSLLSTLAAMLADVQYRQGRIREAQDAIALSQRTASAEDIASQASWRCTGAMIAADRGDLTAAQDLVDQAVAMVEPTDFLELRGKVFEAQAHVHRAAGQQAEAEVALRRALAEHERKENLVEASRIGQLLQELL